MNVFIPLKGTVLIFICNFDRKASVSAMLETLGWCTLEQSVNISYKDHVTNEEVCN